MTDALQPVRHVALVLGATMLIAASLDAWRSDRGFYRPLARTCSVAAVMSLAVAALRPAPLILGIALVALLSIPWVLAVWLRLGGQAGSLPGS